MLELFVEVWIFLKSVLLRWINLFGGAALVFFGFCYSKFTKEEAPVNGSLVFLGCLGVAVFLAWRDEHKKLTARSGLKGEVRYTAYFEADDGRVGIAVALRITNRGEPTIVDGWGLTFLLDGVKHGFCATHFLDGKFDVSDNKGNIYRIKSPDLIYHKIGTDELAKGARRSGFLIFLTKGISYEQLIAARPQITVLFRDAFGNEYEAVQQGDGITTPLYEPGLDDPFAAILIRQAKEAKAGEQLYYAVVERINKGSRPIMALLEMGVADELDTNEDVVNFCNQLVADEHGDPFEHLRIIYQPLMWREFLRAARRKHLKFPDEMSELSFMNDLVRQHEMNVQDSDDSLN